MTNVTKLRAKPTVPELERPVHSVPADDLVAAGKRLRDTVPRASQGEWKRPKDRRDPLEILQASDEACGATGTLTMLPTPVSEAAPVPG